MEATEPTPTPDYSDPSRLRGAIRPDPTFRYLALAVVVMLVLGGGAWRQWGPQPKVQENYKTPEFVAADYYLVTLTRGDIYVGKLTGLEGGQPVLSDVFYINRNYDEVSRLTYSHLFSRKADALHGPTEMHLNPGEILSVEQVGKYSRVAAIIAEWKRRGI